MVRVSEYYGLSGDQGTLDFVDVEIDRDTLLFIDPSVIASIDGPWEHACISAIQSFFQEVIDCIKAGDKDKAKSLLSHLSEDNSTRLGYSKRNRGSGVGSKLSEEFFTELSASDAVHSGLISDIEDTALLIEGVGEDRISDVVTNIIRNLLIEYTQAAAAYYGIPLKNSIAVPPYWGANKRQWVSRYFDLPVAGKSPLILVPKSIVRRLLFINPGEYYSHYVLTYLMDDEVRRQSPLVRVFKTQNKQYVTKKDVAKKYKKKHSQDGRRGVEKRINVEATERFPSLIAKYKADKAKNPPRGNRPRTARRGYWHRAPGS
ncbi:hypothetical protein [Nocardia sp. NPDC059691]|uniref:hypothetical protein n=1 Tax=Nocardia sp. NPDC059691 TaxID=3346908 RepID=UPI003674A5ED